MNIFIIIAIFISIYALINYRKAFLIFLILGLFLNQNINMINIPGVPLLTLNTAMIVVFLIIYFLNRKKIATDHNPFPFKKAFYFSVVSYIISTIFSVAGFNNSVTAIIKVFLEEYLFVWLIWIVIKDISDVKFIIKCLVFVFCFICLYGFYEFITKSNPIADYEVSIAGSGNRVIDWRYDDEFRGYRIKSVFFHAIGGGLNFAMFGLFISYLVLKFNSLYRLHKFPIIIALLSVTCMFLTNSRGPIIFLLVGIIPFVNLKNKYFYITTVAFVAITTYYSDSLSQYLINIVSIFDSKASEQVGGSSLNMRLDQLDASISTFITSPLWGLGPKGYEYIPNSLMERLLGLESVWFLILIERGLLGVVSYLYLMYVLIVKLGRKSKNVLYFSLAFFTAFTATSLPGGLIYLFYLIVIILIKSERWKNEKANLFSKF